MDPKIQAPPMKGAIELEETFCPLGCRLNDTIVTQGYDRIHHLPGRFNVVQCRSCGLMRTNPRPRPESIAFYYPDNYGPYLSTKIHPCAPAGTHPSRLKKIVRHLINFHTASLPVLKPGRLLEIGCASGTFLHKMAGQGWDVEGIEFSRKAALNSQKAGYKIFNGPVEAADFPEQSFDLIAGWMVFEHLYDPLTTLEKFHKWLKPKGLLALSLPNAGALEFKIFKSRWYALHLPNHLYHYTPKSLDNLFQKKDWQITRIFHQRTLSNLIGSIGYLLQDLKSNAGWTNRLTQYPETAGKMQYILYPAALVFGALGQTGRMTVWAGKK